MQAVILEPGPCGDAKARRIVRPSAAMTPGERLEVYRGMYGARLAEALEADFPMLAGLLGEELFAEFASLYICEHPSRSYTLNDLGRNVPALLAKLDGLPSPALSVDLARFELTVSEVFDEEESPRLTTDQLAAVDPESWGVARLRPIRAFRLLELGYPVHLYKQRPSKRARRTWLAVYRRDYAVTWHSLTRPAYGVLSRLAEGEPIGAVLAGIRNRDRVFAWFQEWNQEGFFEAIEVQSTAR
ncbi:MAG: DUF2063 domain-containing protein [Acidobacteria bacterium]|nr:DUF2063 domain-containing protein [Acidobacteriota bacterium]